MGTSADAIAGAVITSLEAAWNAADGTAFAAPFTEDAAFVTIRGEHYTGKAAIGAGHQGIFDTIYRGSTVSYGLLGARALSDTVLLVHARSVLRAPTGPLAGEHDAVSTLVLVRAGDRWQIAAFHNTVVAPARERT